MPETDFSYSQVETPPSGSSLPRGKHRLSGWVWPKAGGHFVDVRARIGGQIFPGIHGLPRADLAAHFNTGRPFALAGFDLIVELAPGRIEVLLEALEIEGRWTVFQAVSYEVAAVSAPVDFATPAGPLRWHEFGRALQLLLRRQAAEAKFPVGELAREIVATIPHPRDLRHPPAPFHGHLDEPAAIARSVFGRIAVLGYLFHETQAITRVLATFDLQASQAIGHQRASPHPAGYFPQFPLARSCELFGLVDVPAQLPDPVCLRLYAELADGSLHLCSAQRSRIFTSEEEKKSYPVRTPALFAATVTALREALAGRNIVSVDDAEMDAELKRRAADFDLNAPGSLIAPAALPPSLPAVATAIPQRILLVTHNLDLEGAPLFLLDYARHLAERGAQITVLSPADGQLRGPFETFGAQMIIVDAAPILAAPSAAAAEEATRQMERAIDFRIFDLVVCNTFTTFWAVHAAQKAGRKVLLYVHESTTPAYFYQGRMSSAVIGLVNEAFKIADVVSFTTASTRNYHTGYGRTDNHRLTPGWIDVARIDRWRAANSRDQLRQRFDCRPGELLVTNVGTVSGRKGQHIFARAVDLLWRRTPGLAARTKFVMLGGRQSSFDALLKDLLEQLGRPNLIVHPETPDYLPYYAAADLFVCSSFEESSPRVILETMACLTPILSSDVQGIAELVRPDLEATLIPPGETSALCDAMIRLLLSPAIGQSLATRARARVVAEFDSSILLPRHAALASLVSAGGSF